VQETRAASPPASDAAADFRFGLLGPLEVTFRGEPVRLGAGKQQALLAVLLLNGNRAVAAERLIDDLWGEDAPDSAAKMVQIHVSQLRKALPAERIRTRRPGYLIELADAELDLTRFERLALEGRQALAAGAAAEAATRLRAALGLWRGAALAEFAEPFAAVEARRIEGLRVAALEERIEADLALGRHVEAAAELEALIARDPLREPLRRRLMVALYRSGRQADALAAFKDFRTLLDDELGIEPSAALRALERQILQQDPALDLPAAAAPAPAVRLQVATPPARESPATPTSLPGRAATFTPKEWLRDRSARSYSHQCPGSAKQVHWEIYPAQYAIARFLHRP